MDDAQLQTAYTSATGQPAGRVERLPGGAGNRTPPDDQRTLTSFTYNVANQLTAAGATT